MIWINKHQSTNRYHTTKCQIVRGNDRCTKINDETMIQRFKERRRKCAYCDGFRPGASRNDMGAYNALLEASPEDI